MDQLSHADRRVSILLKKREGEAARAAAAAKKKKLIQKEKESLVVLIYVHTEIKKKNEELPYVRHMFQKDHEWC